MVHKITKLPYSPNDLIPNEQPALLPNLGTNSDSSTTSLTPIIPFGPAAFQPPRKKLRGPLRPSARPQRPSTNPQIPLPPRLRPGPPGPTPRPPRASPRPPLLPQGLPTQPELKPIGKLVFSDSFLKECKICQHKLYFSDF